MNRALGIWFLFICALIPAPPTESFSQGQLPSSPAGERVSAYIAAYNAGEKEMRAFVETWWAPEALVSVPLDTRMERYRQMRQDLGTIRFYRVESASDSLLSTIVRSERGEWLEFRFGFENAPRRAITWISVQESDDPDQPAVTPAVSVAELLNHTASYVDSLAELDQFSGVVMIAKGDSVLFLKAYGFADREKKAPNRTDTRFNVGSINKVFTRIAVLQLESEGKLSLSDTIGRFLPDYPNAEAARSVTIDHLLSMSSGIGDFFGDRFDAADKEKIVGLKEYLPLFADKPLAFSPGTARRYSNGGYVVLGLIVERASGMDYYDYVRQHVYAPAGMTSSDWFRKSALPSNTARGYSTSEKTSNYATLPGIGSSAGGGYSTAGDLFRFVQSLNNGVLELPERARGLGIAGGAPGLNAALEWDPSPGYVIVVLCNFDPPLASRLAGHIRKSLPRN
jgi:CubicO group peptidase (beta-lactamase class C family)